MNLAEAQQARRVREDAILDDRIDDVLDRVGISLGVANVSPEDRKKLKGILARLARNPKPFTQCMADLRKHQPSWSDDRRKKTCAVLKQLIGRGQSGKKMNASDLDDAALVLLDRADLSQLEACG